MELRQALIILSIMVLFLNLANSVSGIDLGCFSLTNMLGLFHMWVQWRLIPGWQQTASEDHDNAAYE